MTDEQTARLNEFAMMCRRLRRVQARAARAVTLFAEIKADLKPQDFPFAGNFGTVADLDALEKAAAAMSILDSSAKTQATHGGKTVVPDTALHTVGGNYVALKPWPTPSPEEPEPMDFDPA